MPNDTLPVEHNDPINARILAISEDKIDGFVREPFAEIAARAGVAGRDRAGANQRDVARGHDAARAADAARDQSRRRRARRLESAAGKNRRGFRLDVAARSVFRPRRAALDRRGHAGSEYKLWTTLKVPHGFSLQRHGEILSGIVGAEHFRLMPAKGIFTFGVGHVRRKNDRTGRQGGRAGHDDRGPARDAERKGMDGADRAETRIHAGGNSRRRPGSARAEEAGVSLEEFFAIAEDLTKRKIIGRFSTFLEHVKPSAGGVRVTRFNALFHWAVPPGREMEAGGEVGRHEILTHCYWREAGPEFRNVNIMAVAHGTDKALLLEHKAAIDRHLAACGIPVSYTNVFWGGRSEIKPSEISPQIYRQWLAEIGSAE